MSDTDKNELPEKPANTEAEAKSKRADKDAGRGAIFASAVIAVTVALVALCAVALVLVIKSCLH